MTTYKKLVSIYLPEELHQALMSYQKQKELEETSSALSEILTQFFERGNQAKRYATLEQVAGLEAKVTRLSEQVAQLRQSIASSRLTQAALDPSNLSNEEAHILNLVQPTTVTFGCNSFDELEDEPDEVLTDFIEPEKPPSP
jgi:hypothetical protein